MCRDIRILWIGSSMRYFLDIMGIQGFCVFSSFCNTLIIQSCTLVFRIVKYSHSFVDVDMID